MGGCGGINWRGEFLAIDAIGIRRPRKGSFDKGRGLARIKAVNREVGIVDRNSRL